MSTWRGVGCVDDGSSWIGSRHGFWYEDGGVDLHLRFKKLAFQGFLCILCDAVAEPIKTYSPTNFLV